MKKLAALLLVLFVAACGNATTTTTNTTTEPPGFIDFVEQTRLTRDYQNRFFTEHGIGQVTLANCIDGDTAHFREPGNNNLIRIRFLGIDAPESTGVVEPWGRGASSFACQRLTDAQTIVLSSNGTRPSVDSTGSRFLGWVWTDGRLLNLELVQESWAFVTGASGTRYVTALQGAQEQAQRGGERIWSDDEDPDYFGGDPIETDLRELRHTLMQNPEELLHKRVAVTGIVSKRFSTNFFLQYDFDGRTYGMYVFTGFRDFPIRTGDEIFLTGVVSLFGGAFQLTGITFNQWLPRDNDLRIISRNNVVEPNLVSAGAVRIPINPELEGTLVSLQNITITGGTTNMGNNSMTLNGRDASGNTINIRLDANVFIFDEEGIRIPHHSWFVGRTFDFTGIVNRFSNNFQILLLETADFSEVL
ncbi:MAG: thermonuclease family protein [Erysipelotrichales bacterium]|nr:thermonuclease family protein [Erysipelotrichales bacterium]